MKKTLLIVALSFVTQFGFSQTNQSGDREEFPSPKAIDETNEKMPVNNNSKQATIQIVKAMQGSKFSKLDTTLLRNTINLLGECKKKNELINCLRVIISSTPSEAYKSESAEEGKKMTQMLTDESDFNQYNSLLLKWQMLLKPAALGAKWPTIEPTWRSSLQATK